MGPKRIKRMEKQGEAPIRQPKLQESEGLMKGQRLPKHIFTDSETSVIDSKRPKLIEKGLTDFEISKELTKNLPGRTAGTIDYYIRKLIKKDKLDENPNKTLNFTDKEDIIIQSERLKLIEEGLTDNEIAKKLTKRLTDRTAGTIVERIKRLVNEHKLCPNSNKMLYFTGKEDAIIQLERSKLIKKGLTDTAISNKLAKILPGRTVSSIDAYVRRLVKEHKLNANPNKQFEFTAEEDATIQSERPKLIKQGLKDKKISVVLTNIILRRTSGVIDHRIRRLIKEHKLDENPNKMIGFTEVEDAIIRSERLKLIADGLNDGEISKVLTRILSGRTTISINKRIIKLIKKHKLDENPNKCTNRYTTDDAKAQIEALLSRLESQDKGQ